MTYVFGHKNKTNGIGPHVLHFSMLDEERILVQLFNDKRILRYGKSASLEFD